MRLSLLFPALADRPCSDCRRHLYDDRGPHFGRRLERGGRPVPRPPQSPTPCRVCPKIPPGDDPTPANAQELSAKNARAYAFYLECKAVGRFPDDPIVRWAAGLIRQVEDVAERSRESRFQLTMLSAVKGG